MLSNTERGACSNGSAALPAGLGGGGIGGGVRGCDGDRRVFVTTTRPAVVPVAAASFVVLSDAGQADKAALRSIRNRVTGVGGTPHTHPRRGRGHPLDRLAPGQGLSVVVAPGHPQGMGRDLACTPQ